MKLFFASDHAGLNLRRVLMDHAVSLGHDIVDLGPDGSESVDYPDLATNSPMRWPPSPSAQGVAVCGTGIGISIALNRHSHSPSSAGSGRNDRNAHAPAQRLPTSLPLVTV
jgi:ribose 5-phosphate isomerase B